MRAPRAVCGPHPVQLLRSKLLAALRSVATHPGGLRITAYTSLMPLLERMSLVKVREQKEPAWVLTPAERRAMQGVGRDEA